MPLIRNAGTLPYYEPPRNREPEYKCSQSDEARGDLIVDIMSKLPPAVVVEVERGAKIAKKNFDDRPRGNRGFGPLSAQEVILKLACFLNAKTT